MSHSYDAPSSSSTELACSSTLTNLSHSDVPFSFNRFSGIHAKRYIGFTASWKHVRGEYSWLTSASAHPLDERYKPRYIVSRVGSWVHIYFRFAVYETILVVIARNCLADLAWARSISTFDFYHRFRLDRDK